MWNLTDSAVWLLRLLVLTFVVTVVYWRILHATHPPHTTPHLPAPTRTHLLRSRARTHAVLLHTPRARAFYTPRTPRCVARARPHTHHGTFYPAHLLPPHTASLRARARVAPAHAHTPPRGILHTFTTTHHGTVRMNDWLMFRSDRMDE